MLHKLIPIGIRKSDVQLTHELEGIISPITPLGFEKLPVVDNGMGIPPYSNLETLTDGLTT